MPQSNKATGMSPVLIFVILSEAKDLPNYQARVAWRRDVLRCAKNDRGEESSLRVPLNTGKLTRFHAD